MSVIMTKQGMVCAYEPLPEDSFVLTCLGTPDGQRVLTTRHIDDYQAAVDWAVGMANVMEYPITILPITAPEFAARRGGQLAWLDPRQRGELRRVAVASMLEVMRDCPDPELRAEAHEVLTMLGVGR